MTKTSNIILMRKPIYFPFAIVLTSFFTACNQSPETVEDDPVDYDATKVMETDNELEHPDADDIDLSSWDLDEDDYVSREEFNTGMNEQGIFSDWETDEDEVFDEDEWTTTMYVAYDRNEDAEWNENEWELFSDTWDENDEWGTFDDWDINDDDIIDEEEWTEGIGQNDMFAGWEADPNEDMFEEDFYNYTYNYYDASGDDLLDQDEMNTYNEDWNTN